MDFRNEKSKIYCVGGKILAITLIVLTIVYFKNRSNRELADRFFIIQQLNLSLLLILSGTRRIFAQKDKKGCIDLFGGVFMLIFIFIIIIASFFR